MAREDFFDHTMMLMAIITGFCFLMLLCTGCGGGYVRVTENPDGTFSMKQIVFNTIGHKQKEGTTDFHYEGEEDSFLLTSGTNAQGQEGDSIGSILSGITGLATALKPVPRESEPPE